jgi:hypothetical protein
MARTKELPGKLYCDLPLLHLNLMGKKKEKLVGSE